MPKLSYIIPCYYNEANIPVTKAELLANEALFASDVQFEYVLVDDGSKDNTWAELEKFKAEYPEKVTIIKLVANVGSYNAIVSGMRHATGDVNVVIAADLQDPPELIVEMLGHFQKGFKLIIGSRKDRDDPPISKLFSLLFQKLIRKYALPTLPKGGFDFVMFDKVVKEEVLKVNEKNTNVLYLMLFLGFPYVNIPYSRRKRTIGKSRWTFKKKLKLMVDSFVAFSYLPIRAITVGGILFGTGALIYGLSIIVLRALGLIALEGWSTLMFVLLFVSSFQMMALGILGEYIWRILDAQRNRPMYLEEKVL